MSRTEIRWLTVAALALLGWLTVGFVLMLGGV